LILAGLTVQDDSRKPEEFEIWKFGFRVGRLLPHRLVSAIVNSKFEIQKKISQTGLLRAFIPRVLG
jgi:hypothetical protein